MNKIRLKMRLELIEAIRKEILDVGYIYDGDGSCRFIDMKAIKIVQSHFKSEDDGVILNEITSLVEFVTSYIKGLYKRIYNIAPNGLYSGYYYTRDLQFDTVEELEDHFHIGE